jgi:uncharacterized protein
MSDNNYNMPQGVFCWNELMTTDTNKAEKFYNALLGWKYQKNDMGNMVYTMVTQGDTTIGGMLQVPEDKKGHIPSHWMSYIAVDNVDDIAKKAESLGATIIVPVTTAGEFGRFVIVQDPTGAHIAFWEPTQAS